MNSIWIGFDGREYDAFRVCERSIRKQISISATINRIDLVEMQCRGLYRRPTNRVNGVLHDVISDAPMSTEFAISRFLTPRLACRGWALFMDCDMLVRRDLAQLFALADPRYAVMVVKHPPCVGYFADGLKMDGQPQTAYPFKNWSSVMLFNCDHPANRALTVDMINTVPGRALHAFCWLNDSLIGELPPEWNYLVGVTPPMPDPAIVHFTLGIPRMAGYEHCAFADEWRACLGS